MREIKYHQLGTEEYPIPIFTRQGIKWIASEEESVFLPTMREDTTEQFYGRFLRRVISDPSMMEPMTEMIYRFDTSRSGNDKSYGYTIEGSPGSGKTFMAKAFGELMHPLGAFVVNCESLDNPDELYRTTTFNVGQKDKTRQIDSHLKIINKEGKELLPETIEYLQKMLEDAVSIEEREGQKIVAIDWVGALAKVKNSSYIEGVCDKVMSMEGIEYKENQNNVGFATSNGPLLQALSDQEDPNYGRIVILDESNRIPQVDAWLQIKSFLSEQGTPKITLKGEDDIPFTLKRKELPPVFFCFSTCNEATDDMGTSAKELTKPMISREGANIDICKIPNPSKADFFSRTLKHLTGVPAYYVYITDPEYYDNHPQELSEILLDMRTIGLSAEEKKQIPEEELFNIKHIDRTLRVAEHIANFVYEAREFAKEASQNEALPQKYRDYLTNRALLDLRYVFKLIQRSESDRKIEATETEHKSPFKGRRKSASSKTDEERQITTQEKLNKRIKARQKNRMYTRGSSLDYTVVERVIDLIKPTTINDYLDDVATYKEDAEAVQTLAEGIQDIAKRNKFASAGYVGEDSVEKLYNAREDDFPSHNFANIKEVITSSIQKIYNKQGLTSEDIIDDDILEEAIALLSTNINNEEISNNIAIPNHDMKACPDEPILIVHTTSLDGNTENVNPNSLITSEQFIDSLIIKQLREYNMKKLEAEHVEITEDASGAPERSKKIANGCDSEFFTTCVMVNNSQGQENGDLGKAYIIYNKKNGETVILADFEPSGDDRAKLKDASIVFVNYNKAETNDYEAIANFLKRQIYNSDVDISELLNSVMLRVNQSLANISYDENSVATFLSIFTSDSSTSFGGETNGNVVLLSNEKYKTEQKLEPSMLMRRNIGGMGND